MQVLLLLLLLLLLNAIASAAYILLAAVADPACRLCHDEAVSSHKMDRYAVAEMVRGLRVLLSAH